VFFFILSFCFSLEYLPPNQVKTSNNFSTPKGIEHKVDFWIGIFSKYDENKIIVHDSLHLVVYEVIDISDINKIDYFSNLIKKEIIDSRVLRTRKKYQEALLRIANQDYDKDDLYINSIIAKFDNFNEENIYYKAARINRIRAQRGLKSEFRKAIYYSSRYLPMMEDIFKEYNLPLELTRIPYIESLFNNFAVSHLNAVGMWQFLEGTANPYLKINKIYDERKDPKISTIVAAKYLKKSYQQLKSWPLAVTSYNHGIFGMKRAVKATGSNNIVDIINNYTHKSFGFASRNFYPEFLAALYVDKYKEILFENLEFSRQQNTTMLITLKNYSINELEAILGFNKQLIKYYNPAISSSFFENNKIRLPKGAKLRVPLNVKYKETLERSLSLNKIKKFERVI